MIPYEQYVKKHNKVCFCYSGMIPEYAVQLDYLIPAIREYSPELDVTLCVRDEFIQLIRGGAVPYSRWDEIKDDFLYVKQVKTNPNGEHPIWSFVKDTPLVFDRKEPTDTGRLCLVCPDAAYPSKSLTPDQCKRLVRLVAAGGCQPVILGSDLHPSHPSPDRVPSGSDKHTYIEDASWVVGAENEYVFMAAAAGVKTTLIPTGPGTELFRTMFPHGEVNERL